MAERFKLIILVLLVVVQAQAVFAADVSNPYDAYRRGDYEIAFPGFKELADQGYASAQFNLGLMYDQGRGVAQNYQEAVKWYRKAADQGFAAAQSNLGLMYDQGRGVVQNYQEAVKWYRKATDQGDAGAQFFLGVMYEEGRGVTQNFVTAYMWLVLASVDGNKYAVNSRNRLAQKMTPSQIAEAQKMAREWKLAKK